MSWPSGFHEDLVVFSGRTEIIPAGEVRDYRSITIEPGGVLEIDRGGVWTSIGCKGDLIVRGAIRATKGDYSASVAGTGPDGFNLFASPAVRSGGTGGNAWNRGGTFGGTQASGNGGGGAASMTSGGSADANAGGRGATKPPIGSPNLWRIAPGGPGGILGIPNGTPGGSINDNIEGGGAIGGGGGGGARGYHGGLIYLRVLGNVDFRDGIFDLSGAAGGTGGQGGSAHAPFRNDIRAGGGGGGGAGGNGGHVLLRYNGAYSAGAFFMEAGRGGVGGPPGDFSYRKTDPQAQPGSAGENGVVGSFNAMKV